MGLYKLDYYYYYYYYQRYTFFVLLPFPLHCIPVRSHYSRLQFWVHTGHGKLWNLKFKLSRPEYMMMMMMMMKITHMVVAFLTH